MEKRNSNIPKYPLRSSALLRPILSLPFWFRRFLTFYGNSLSNVILLPFRRFPHNGTASFLSLILLNSSRGCFTTINYYGKPTYRVSIEGSTLTGEARSLKPSRRLPLLNLISYMLSLFMGHNWHLQFFNVSGTAAQVIPSIFST